MDPITHHVQLQDIELAVYEWGKPADPAVLLMHATGFHARCWDRTVAELGPGYRVIAVDQRGHGRSQNAGPFNWDIFGADLIQLLDKLDVNFAVGAGHSMGGHVLVQAAAEHPSRFGQLLLVDPVIMAPEAYVERAWQSFTKPEEHPTSRRRNEWASWEEMFARFKDRHPFSLWRMDVLEDYCRYGLVPSGEGDAYELACPPLVEASIYMGSDGTDVLSLVRALDIPTVVMRAPPREPTPEGAEQVMDFSKSPTWPGLAGQFPQGREQYLPELTHFIPMQRPDLVAEAIRSGIAGLG